MLDAILEKYETRVSMDTYSKQFLLGFSQGAFKTQARKGSSCLSDGYQLASAALSLAYSTLRTKDEDDSMNFNDIATMLMKKCNMGDSIEGTFATNYLINRIDEYQLASLKPLRFALKTADFATLLGDVSEWSLAFQGFLVHEDMYNAGIFLGKLSSYLDSRC